MKMRYAINAIAPQWAKANWKPWGTCLIFALLLSVAAGCATAKPPPRKVIFFPGAPDPPRLQFLTSYNSAKDLTGNGSSFAEFITGQKPTDYTLGKPYGIALYQSKFYVCDSILHGIVILDLAKGKVGPLQTPEEGALVEPLNITIDPDGVRYITDDARNQVICLDAQDQFKWILGKKGEMQPRDVAVSSDRIFVADIQHHCVRVYEKKTRQPLFTIPREQDTNNANALLALPTNLALDTEGRLYVSDSLVGRVQVYNNSGKYVRSLGVFGDNPPAGTLKRPKGVAVDREGLVYVVDAAYQLVQMFDSSGRYLMWFGYPGDTPAALTLPAKVIVDYDHVRLFEKYAAPDFKVEHLVIVTSQFGNRKVSVFGFGHKK
jgi:DNA-binding beta-propeller fold protein YncE